MVFNSFFAKLTVTFSFFMIFIGSAYAESESIIAHSSRPNSKNAGSDLSNRLLHIKFDCDHPTSVIINALSAKDELFDNTALNGNALFYSSRKVERKGKLNIASTTPSFTFAELDKYPQKKDLSRLNDLLKPMDKGSLNDFNISNKGDKVVFILKKYDEYKGARVTTSAICIYDLKTDEIKTIVPFGFLCGKPVFSPNDDKLAFYRAPLDIWSVPSGYYTNDKNGYVLCAINIDGTGLKVISPPSNTISTKLNSAPAWSPDGNKILFVSRYNEPGVESKNLILEGIYITDIRKDGIERLTPVGWGMSANYPSWSPDGTCFCYTLHAKLMVMNVITRKTVELNTDEYVSACVWSSKNNLIAFAEADSISRSDDKLSIISSDGKVSLKHILPVDVVFHKIFWVK